MYLSIGWATWDYEGCSEPQIYGLYSTIEKATKSFGKAIDKCRYLDYVKYPKSAQEAGYENAIAGWWYQYRGGSSTYLILKLEVDNDV